MKFSRCLWPLRREFRGVHYGISTFTHAGIISAWWKMTCVHVGVRSSKDWSFGHSADFDDGWGPQHFGVGPLLLVVWEG